MATINEVKVAIESELIDQVNQLRNENQELHRDIQEVQRQYNKLKQENTDLKQRITTLEEPVLYELLTAEKEDLQAHLTNALCANQCFKHRLAILEEQLEYKPDSLWKRHVKEGNEIWKTNITDGV